MPLITPAAPAPTGRRALALLALLALVVSGAAALPQARATATAPVISVSSDPVPENPIELQAFDPDSPPPDPAVCTAASGDPDDESCFDYEILVGADQVLTGAVVTVVESEDLYVVPRTTTLDTIGPDPTPVRLAVRSLTPGTHQLKIRITAEGAAPQSLRLRYLWSPGGPPIDDSAFTLAGRHYGRNGVESRPCRTLDVGPEEGSTECTVRTADRVSFLDDTRSSTSFAVDGRAGCPRPGRCRPYLWDRARSYADKPSGWVQLGQDTIGRVTSKAAFFDGEPYTMLAYPRPGQYLDGLWGYAADVDEGRGVVRQRLRLRKDLRFRLSYAVEARRATDRSYSRTLRGRYTIGRNGRLALKTRGRGATVATLLLGTNYRGSPEAQQRGVWLDLPVARPGARPYVDGNLLAPVSPAPG